MFWCAARFLSMIRACHNFMPKSRRVLSSTHRGCQTVC